MGKNVIISTLPNISQNYLPKVNTSNIFANSLVYDNGTNVMLNTTATHSSYTNARLVVNNTGNSYLEVRGDGGQGTIALTTSSSTTSNFPTVEIFNSADFGIVGYRPGVVSSNYIMYYELSSSTNRRLTFQTEGVTRLAIQGAGRILMGPTLPTDDGTTALQVNGGGKFSSNVGIGATLSNWYSTVSALQISTSAALWSLSGGQNTLLSTNEYIDAAAATSRYIANGVAMRYQQNAGEHRFSTAASGIAGNAITYSQVMTITSGGNVGIGSTVTDTVSNFTTLQIDGTSGSYIRTGTSNYGGYFATIPTADVLVIANVRNPVNGVFSNTGKASSRMSLYGESGNSYITFATSTSNNTDPTERMRITSGGKVGINWDSPASQLSVRWDRSTAFSGIGVYDSQVYNASNHGGTITFGGTYTSGNSYTEWAAVGGIKENTNDSDYAGALAFYTRPNGGGMSERMRITSGGDVQVTGNITLNTGANRILRIGSSTAYYYDLQSVGDNFEIREAGTTTRFKITYPSGQVTISNLAGSGTRTVTADASGNLAASSDSSLKQEDTTHRIEGLSEILQLQPKAYKWLNDIEVRGEEAVTEIGFFADEVAPIIPSAAPKCQDGLYGFYDRAVIAAMVKAIQELNQKITLLENK